MIDANLLEYLYVFSKEGSLLKASEILHLSQPSLSKAMQKLEAELGITIFSRSKNKIALNENGKALLPYIEDIINVNNKLTQKAKEINENEYSISIGLCAPGPMFKFRNLFMYSLNRFKITTQIESYDQLIRGLNSNVYDLIFVNKSIIDENLICRKVMSEHLYISIPKTHFLAGMKDGVHWKDIDGQSFLLFNYTGVWESLLDKHLTHSRFLRSSDNSELKEIAENSTIPSFVTDVTLKSNAAPNRINIPILDEDATIDFYAVCKKKNAKLLTYLNN